LKSLVTASISSGLVNGIAILPVGQASGSAVAASTQQAYPGRPLFASSGTVRECAHCGSP